MGQYSSDLFAELARSSDRFGITEGMPSGEFEDRVFDSTAQNLIAQFKDALFVLVMLRARNFMIAANKDAEPDARDKAVQVDISIRLDPDMIVHIDEMTEGKEVSEYTRARGIFPTVVPSLLDTLGGTDLSGYVDDLSVHMLLACK